MFAYTRRSGAETYASAATRIQKSLIPLKSPWRPSTSHLVSARKDMESLIAEARRQGWRAEKTRGGHWRLYSPTGRGIVHLSGTPSSGRAVQKAASMMRHFGFVWKGH
jgi:hypothetical protein